MIGKKLGQRYKIESEISEGGMGTVYKANHEYLGSPVALKILPLYSDENMKKRFLSEALKAMACKHDNVVGMFDYVEEKSGAHFAGRKDQEAPAPAAQVLAAELHADGYQDKR